ncbi:hypothetical protein [Hymenobacter sp. AT01-02]|nr:hypothetical protein [Hymenobacter sp. AT01-02]
MQPILTSVLRTGATLALLLPLGGSRLPAPRTSLPVQVPNPTHR